MKPVAIPAVLVIALAVGGAPARAQEGHPIPPSSRGYLEIFSPEKASRYRVSILSWDFLRTPSRS